MGEGKLISIKGLIDEDFVNYKKISMTIMFPRCSFKCGFDLCQNYALDRESDIEVTLSSLYERYVSNPITHAIVLQGLEPVDSWDDVLLLLEYFRFEKQCQDDIVIYTGYTEDEISDKIEAIKPCFHNVIIKFGRYVPNQQPHYDEVLGVKLVSDNQYAKRIS